MEVIYYEVESSKTSNESNHTKLYSIDEKIILSYCYRLFWLDQQKDEWYEWSMWVSAETICNE